MRALYIAFVVSALALIGCGGKRIPFGPPGTGGSGGTTGGQPVTTSVLMASIRSVETKFNTLLATEADRDKRNDAMVAYIKTLPAFKDAGRTPGGTVWGTLKDNTHYVLDDTMMDPPSRSARRMPRPITKQSFEPPTRDAADWVMADDPKATLMYGMDFSPWGSYLADQKSRLEKRNYAVSIKEASLENYASVSGDAYFYVATHGGYDFDPISKTYAWGLWSTTPVTEQNEAVYGAERQSGALTIWTAAASWPNNKPQIETHYAITRKWCEEHNWKFQTHALVFLSACYSDVDGSTSDIGLMSGGNLGILGWSNPAEIGKMLLAAKDLVAGLTGVTHDAFPGPPERPFPLGAVMGTLHGLGDDDATADPKEPCKLISRGENPLLAPSVGHMDAHERLTEDPLSGPTRLYLHGYFGDKQGTVKIGGTEVPIIEWKRDQVTVEPAMLPGPGFAGAISLVEVNHFSNQVELTQWNGSLKYEVNAAPPENIVLHFPVDAVFRGDIHPVIAFPDAIDREIPDSVHFRAAQGSKSHWSYTGSAPGEDWVRTEGDAPFGLNGTVNTPWGQGYIFQGILNAKAKTTAFAFNFLDGVLDYYVPGNPVLLHHAGLRDPGLIGNPNGSRDPDGALVYDTSLLPGVFGSDWSVPGKSIQGTLPAAFGSVLTWTAFTPTFAPKPDDGDDISP